ncbi:MAG: phosphopeptide-binding protein [Bacteroidota bacterium]
MRTFPIYFLLALFLVACGGNTATEEAATDTEVASEEATSEETASSITLTPMPETPDYPGAMITDMSYENGTFNFAIDGGEDGYELGGQTPDAEALMCANSAKGQHIHLIVDNEPYAAKYEASFDYEIADGEHYILSFISRSYHESIKHEGASRAVVGRVVGNSLQKSAPVTTPMLFYSRPKGTYVGKDTENIMLDFYPVNAELGNGYQVQVEVAGETFTVDTWQPYFLKGLGMGEHTVTLTLLDADGNPVDAPLNPVSRTITLEEDKGDS